MPVRQAATGDVPRMAELAERKREQYEAHAPQFHRRKANALALHEPFLASLVSDERSVTLVHESGDGKINGFLIATLVAPPPVYDPGGLTCLVDDFVVGPADLWDSAGRQLLERAIALTHARGAVQSVVVCGPHDRPKRELLLSMGHAVVSEWFTLPFTERSPRPAEVRA